MKVMFGFILFLGLLSFTNSDLFQQTGNASYYANKFHGRKTSSGEKYHKDSLVCAHKTLKFGTVLKVTNLKNDSTIIVRVIDRMGKSSPHIIDLSMAGAKQLNFVRNGITKVKIEQIAPVVSE
jgi:rare lipoprotein A